MLTNLRRFGLILFGFFLMNVLHAQEIPEGIYVIHEKGDGPKVKRNDTGDTLVLGKRLTDKFGSARIDSTANDNSRFRLELTGAGPIPKGTAPGAAALLLDGRCFMVYSRSDPEADGRLNLGSVIHNDEAMRTVAKTLKVEPRLRVHPGHKMLVTWETDKPNYKVGDPIGITVKIKNVGEQPFTFMNGGRQRGPRDNQFGFTAYRTFGYGKAVPDTGDPNNHGGIGGYVTLKPVQEFSKAVVLDKWFTFTEPDSYRITGTFQLELRDTNDGAHSTLWDDYAVGTCVVRVESPKK